MQEHPIPQQISSYQFRLIGDMTLKQFFQVAGGTLVSLFFYSSGLPSFIKWPLIIISFLAGVAFAFFPLGNRPLSKWIFLFLKSIYSPTIFVWKKPEEKISPAQAPRQTGEVGKELAPSLTIEKVHPETKKLEEAEVKFLSKIQNYFSQPLEPVFSKYPKVKPVPKVEKETFSYPSKTEVKIYQVKPAEVDQKQESKEAQFSAEAAPPAPPTMPNLIIGQVLDESDRIVEGAIVEIKDEKGKTVRALRTNKLGHFVAATPLENGIYHIITEKEPLSFEPLKVEVQGKIIPPIAIKARSQKTN